MKQVNLPKLFILTTLMLAIPGVSKADIIQFSPGTDIVSADMNVNFMDLDQRLADIEAGNNRIEPIDCSAPNEDAFLLETITDNTTYVQTGMCNGPISIWRKRNVIIER